MSWCAHTSRAVCDSANIFQIYSTLLLPANLTCLVLAGRPLHSTLTAQSIKGPVFRDVYHRQTGIKTILSLLDYIKFAPWLPYKHLYCSSRQVEEPLPFFSNRSLAAGLCQTCTRDISPLHFLFFTYTSATSITGWRGPDRSNKT